MTKQMRRVHGGQVVALGQIVDQLAEAAEVDQELDADHVDEREDQARAAARRRCWAAPREAGSSRIAGERDSRSCGRRRSARGAWRAGLRASCRMTGANPAAKPIMTMVSGIAAEDHQKQRIDEHQRRRRHRARSSSRPPAQTSLAPVQQHAQRDRRSTTSRSPAAAASPAVMQEAAEDVLLGDDPRERQQRSGWAAARRSG